VLSGAGLEAWADAASGTAEAQFVAHHSEATDASVAAEVGPSPEVGALVGVRGSEQHRLEHGPDEVGAAGALTGCCCLGG
jgi:hypothetical protein